MPINFVEMEGGKGVLWYACRTVGARLTRFGSADWHGKKFVYDIVFESVLFGSHPKENKH